MARRFAFSVGMRGRNAHATAGRMPTLHEFRPLSPIGPIQASILDGFGDVFGFEIGDVIQVSDCACDFQNAVVAAGAQACCVMARSMRRSQSADNSQKVRIWRELIWALQ